MSISIKYNIFCIFCIIVTDCALSAVSTNSTNFTSNNNGVYTVTIPQTQNTYCQTNPLVMVKMGQVFKLISAPTSQTPLDWYGGIYGMQCDVLLISVDGTNYVEAGIPNRSTAGPNSPTQNALTQEIEIAGPAWIMYVHQIMPLTNTCVVTYGLYPTPRLINIKY